MEKSEPFLNRGCFCANYSLVAQSNILALGAVVEERLCLEAERKWKASTGGKIIRGNFRWCLLEEPDFQ